MLYPCNGLWQWRFHCFNVVGAPVYGSNNTLSLGGASGGKLISNQCIMCGNCNVGEFGGICPKAQCPKGLLNGPCGGAVDGMCEVNRLRRMCLESHLRAFEKNQET